MPNILFLQGLKSSTAIPASIVFTDNSVSGTNGTVFTFSSQSLGTATTDRQILVTLWGRDDGAGSPALTSVTVGGVTATVDITYLSGSNRNRAAVVRAAVPTGTTGDVVVTFDTTVERCGIGVYAMYDAATSVTDTGFSEASTMTDTLNIPANGVAVGIAAIGGGGRTYTWTNLSEDFDEAVEGDETYTGAHDAFETEQTALAITCTPSGVDASGRSFVIASYGPA